MFKILIKRQGRKIELTATLILSDRYKEQWRLTNFEYDFIIQSNRPHIRKNLKLKHFRVTWKPVSGKPFDYVFLVDDAGRMIEEIHP